MLWCNCGAEAADRAERRVFADQYQSDANGNPFGGGPPVWGSFSGGPIDNGLEPNFPVSTWLLTTAPAIVGAKLVSAPEMPSFPWYQTRYFGTTISQATSIPPGATITSARLRLRRASVITTDPPAPISTVVRVCTSTFRTANSLPWLIGQWDVNTAALDGFSFHPRRTLSLSGNATFDLTADVQAVVNQPTWLNNGTNQWLTVIVYATYPQTLWVNNIHPTQAYPSAPGTNTAVWWSDPQGSTEFDQTNAVLNLRWTP